MREIEADNRMGKIQIEINKNKNRWREKKRSNEDGNVLIGDKEYKRNEMKLYLFLEFTHTIL